MVNPVAVGIVIALLVLALIGMAVSWRRRGRSQRHLVVPPLPADAGVERVSAAGLYLATTFAGRPLERVMAAGLGFRARARVAVTDRGVLLERTGSAPLFLPADRLTGAGTATWTIDRVVERDGLLVVGWSLPSAAGGAEAVESTLRLDPGDQVAVAAAVDDLARRDPAPAAPFPEDPRADDPS